MTNITKNINGRTVYIEGDLDDGLVVLGLPKELIEAGPAQDVFFVTLETQLLKEIVMGLLRVRMIKNLERISTNDLVSWLAADEPVRMTTM